MDYNTIFATFGFFWSPAVFAVCVTLAVAAVWRSFAPVQRQTEVTDRLDGYLGQGEIDLDGRAGRPFVSLALLTIFRKLLNFLGQLLPQRNIEMMHKMLQQAGEPGKLTVLDFAGLRLLCVVLVGVGYFVFFGSALPLSSGLVRAAAIGSLGYFLPLFWLRQLGGKRRHQILRALPDALDMLTIGVEAGLAFESAMLKVGEKWDNALTREFRRAVTEMQVGMTRERALERMAERVSVNELSAFVAVLVQSAQLGVSIAQVLHAQAAEMRLKRRQRAEELARQAGVKMTFPLVLFIMPALFVVILGPAIPAIMEGLSGMGG